MFSADMPNHLFKTRLHFILYLKKSFKASFSFLFQKKHL